MSINTFLQALRIFNTWIGDPSKVILLEAVVKVIKQQNLLSLVNEVGNHLWSGLHDLEVSYCVSMVTQFYSVNRHSFFYNVFIQ